MPKKMKSDNTLKIVALLFLLVPAMLVFAMAAEENNLSTMLGTMMNNTPLNMLDNLSSDVLDATINLSNMSIALSSNPTTNVSNDSIVVVADVLEANNTTAVVLNSMNNALNATQANQFILDATNATYLAIIDNKLYLIEGDIMRLFNADFIYKDRVSLIDLDPDNQNFTLEQLFNISKELDNITGFNLIVQNSSISGILDIYIDLDNSGSVMLTDEINDNMTTTTGDSLVNGAYAMIDDNNSIEQILGFTNNLSRKNITIDEIISELNVTANSTLNSTSILSIIALDITNLDNLTLERLYNGTLTVDELRKVFSYNVSSINMTEDKATIYHQSDNHSIAGEGKQNQKASPASIDIALSELSIEDAIPDQPIIAHQKLYLSFSENLTTAENATILDKDKLNFSIDLLQILSQHGFGTIQWANGLQSYEIIENGITISANSNPQLELETGKVSVLDVLYRFYPIQIQKECRTIVISDIIIPSDYIMLSEGESMRLPVFRDCNMTFNGETLLAIKPQFSLYSLGIAESMTHTAYSANNGILILTEIVNGTVVIDSQNSVQADMEIKTDYSIVNVTQVLHGMITIGMPILWQIDYKVHRDGRSFEERARYLTAPIYLTESSSNDDDVWSIVVTLGTSYAGIYDNISLQVKIPESGIVELTPSLPYSVDQNSSGRFIMLIVPEMNSVYSLTINGSIDAMAADRGTINDTIQLADQNASLNHKNTTYPDGIGYQRNNTTDSPIIGLYKPLEELLNETELETEHPVINSETLALKDNAIEPNISDSSSIETTIILENDTNRTLIQDFAEIGKPVKWRQQMKINKSGKIEFALPENSVNIRLNAINNRTKKDVTTGFTERNGKNTGDRIVSLSQPQENSTIYEINYETPAAQLKEEKISGRLKRVQISGPDSVHYSNVLSYASPPMMLSVYDAEKIRLYWINNGTKQEHPFKAVDSNNDSIIDLIEWVTPHLSNQTFEIIVISQADHLDSNKDFISDISAQVKSMDGVWSETIDDQDYIRVIFEKPLSRNNDITIYPRIISGNPEIIIFEFNQSIEIARFTDFMSEEFNKVFLSSLIGEQDTFDLKIIGGQVEFDQIVDPSIGACQNISTPGIYTLTASITNFANGCFNITVSNVTLDGAGFTIDGNDLGTDYGIYVFNGTTNLTNITIKNFVNITDFAIGILAIRTNLSNILNLTTSSNTLNGISLSFNSSYNHLENITVFSNRVTGIHLSSRSNFNNLTNITANLNNRDGINLNSSFNNNLTLITTNRNNWSGIYLNSSSYNNITSLTANLNNLSAIYLNTSSNNTFFNGTLNGSRRSAINLVNIPTFGNKFINITVSSTNISFSDINMSTLWINGTIFTDMNTLKNYSFTGNGGTIVINETGIGSIKFLRNVSGNGQNFIGDIQISDNFVYVDSVKRGLNVSANITLFNVPVYPYPAIYRDGTNVCNATTVPACYNFTPLTAGTVVFNVTSWSNYTVNDLGAITACRNLTRPNIIYTLLNDITDTTANCLNVTASNIIIDGNGFTLDGNDLGTDYGIYVFNSTGTTNLTNITIKNFANITDFAIGIYATRTNKSYIWNLTASSNTVYGISLSFNSSFNDLENVSVNSNGVSGLHISSLSNNNNLTNITASSNGRDGIYVNSSLRNNFTLIDASQNNFSGLYLNSSAYNNVTSMTANSNNISGIYLNSSSNNSFFGGLIDNSVKSPIMLVNLPSFGNEFNNVSFSNANESFADINISTAGINGTEFIDMFSFHNYSFAGNGGTIIVNSTTYGAIKFLRNVSGSGQNFIADISINDNLAYVNSSKVGLNVSANVTLYNVPVYTFPSIYRDGTNICNSTTTPACFNLTTLFTSTVVFNVSSWSNYSIIEMGVTGCGNLSKSNTEYTLMNSITGITTTCFNITGSNITFDGNGYTIDGDDLGTDYGIYVFNGTTNQRNITLKNFANITDFHIGIYALKTNQSFIWNLSANNNTGYGISLSLNSSYNDIENVTVNSNRISGLYISSRSNNSNFTNITANWNGKDGIYLNSSLNNSFVQITADGNNFSGIYFNSSSYNNVTSFTADLNNISGIYLNSSSNNTFNNGQIDGSGQSAILLAILPTFGNVFNNVAVINTNASFADINVSTAMINGTTLVDMIDLYNYSFTGNGGTIIVNETGIGSIRFWRNISGSGQNLSSDIMIGSNFAYVNSSKRGLNVSANITLYGLDAYPHPVIYRDGTNICNSTTIPACTNFSILNSGTAAFNVTYWSNYSIGVALTRCINLTKPNFVYPMRNSITNFANGCFNITGSNITLDGNGFTIDGNDLGTDYGIYVFNGTSNVSNVTIKNIANITDFTIGIYLARTNLTSIRNITSSSNIVSGITISINSSYNELENITSFSNRITGIHISSGSNFNNLTNISVNLNNRDGIYINSSFNNNLSLITAIRNNYSAIYLNSSNYNDLSDLTANVNNLSGIYLNSSSNNTFIHGTINGSRRNAIFLVNLPTFGNIFTDILITNNNASYTDINISTPSINGTKFWDMQALLNYSFAGNGNVIIVNQTGIGSIEFLSNVSGSGNNFSSDVQITNNYVYVNSSKRGLNVSANVTLYNVPIYLSPRIYRDGNITCNTTTIPSCYNFTPLVDGTVKFNVTSWSNYTIGESPPELIVNLISFSNNSAVEGQDVTVFVNVTNIGYTNSTNFTVQLNVSAWTGTSFTLNQTYQSDYLNLTIDELGQVNFTWIVQPGIFEFSAYVDNTSNVTEIDETNNTYSINYTTSGWQILYGFYNYTMSLSDGSSINMSEWAVTLPEGNSFYSDDDSQYNALDLRPLNDTNDFIEADTALNMTGFNDSIRKLFDADNNGKADLNISFTIGGVVINNISIINVSSESAFITGVMWDSADGGLQYDGTQDLVFVTKLNSSKIGAYGSYDYEVKIPSRLENLKGSTDLVKRIDELS